MAIDACHLPSGQQRCIEHRPLAHALVFRAQAGAQATGFAIFLWPRAKVSDDEPAIASVATAATRAALEINFII